jgi:hypothetical protein
MSEIAQRGDGTTADAACPEKRRYLRKKVIWSARVESAIGERQCAVLNISRGGAQIKLDATLDTCSTVAISIPGIGRLPGWVVWSSYDRAGIQFSELSGSLASALEQALLGRRGKPIQPVPSQP